MAAPLGRPAPQGRCSGHDPSDQDPGCWLAPPRWPPKPPPWGRSDAHACAAFCCLADIDGMPLGRPVGRPDGRTPPFAPPPPGARLGIVTPCFCMHCRYAVMASFPPLPWPPWVEDVPPPLPPLPPHAALSMRLPAMAAPPNSRIIVLLSITVFSLDIRMVGQPPEEGPWLTEVAVTVPSLAWAPWTMTLVPGLRSLAEPFWRMRILVVPVTFTWTTPPAVWT